MNIDFTKLENIACNGENEAIKQVNPYSDNPGNKNALNKPTEAKNGINRISEVRLNKEQENNAKTAEMYRYYQENISRSQAMTAELLKGVQAGEDQTLLLLKAVKIISMMTGNELFYNQFEADLKSINGAGFLEPYPLELELKQIQERLSRLEEAEQRPEETEENKQRIKNAITAHQKRKKQITLLLSEAV